MTELEFFSNKNLLVVVAHHDDIEFMFGGLIARIIKERINAKLKFAVFCDRFLNTGEESSLVHKQQLDALKILGVDLPDITNFGYRARFLNQYEDEIRIKLREINKEFNCDIILTHNRDDLNQDHACLALQTQRALKGITNISGEILNTGAHLQKNFFIRLSEEDLKLKFTALQKYTQESSKRYFKWSAIQSHAEIMGLYSGKYEYAEPLQVNCLLLG